MQSLVHRVTLTVFLACGLFGLWFAVRPSVTAQRPDQLISQKDELAADTRHVQSSAPNMTRPFGLTVTQPAKGHHSGTVILLHGLGDTAHGWAPVGPQLNLPHLKFVYPTAPTRPITINMGMRMPGWFDITHLDPASLNEMVVKGKAMDPEGVAESMAHVNALIDAEVRGGVPPSRIVVGGFSQGGHIALKVALTHTPPLAGCAALSTWLEPSKFEGHGDSDPLIPPAIGVATHDVLKGRGCTAAEFHMYNGMAHGSCRLELNDLRDFLLRVLPEQPPKKVTSEELAAMSARELKQFVESRGASTVGLFEKQDLLDKAKSLL